MEIKFRYGIVVAIVGVVIVVPLPTTINGILISQYYPIITVQVIHYLLYYWFRFASSCFSINNFVTVSYHTLICIYNTLCPALQKNTIISGPICYSNTFHAFMLGLVLCDACGGWLIWSCRHVERVETRDLILCLRPSILNTGHAMLQSITRMVTC